MKNINKVLQSFHVAGKNQIAAKIFYEIADFLEIQGVQWKPVAYRRVARAIESLNEDVEEIYKRGGIKALKEIPGVGENISKKLEEIITTGKLSYHERLKKEFPFDIESLTEIPGLGPKKAKKLYDALKVKNREELKKAAEEGRVRKVEGFDAKSEENILKGIALLERTKGRVLLGYAFHEINSIIEKLKSKTPVRRISAAGSVRRMKETIGDLDILVTSEQPEKVMEYFTSMPEVESVIARGTTKSAVLLKSGLNCDLRVVSDEEYGSALQYFTGSKEHNIALRKIALSKGMKLSEYGLFKDGKRIAGREEEDVYKALGLQWTPPELRENWGEIEAAQKGKLPNLVQLNDIKGDFHAHTDWSDGSNTIIEIAIAAEKLGYEYLAITDHAGNLKIAGGLDEKRLAEHSAAVEAAEKNANGIRLLKGAEVDINKDGSLAVSASALDDLDFVIAAIHSNFNMPEKEMTSRVLKAMEEDCVDAIAHPSCREIGSRDPVKLDFDALYQAAVDTGTLLEINAYPTRLDLWDAEIKRAKEEFGVEFVIGTDSHSTHHLRFMEIGLGMARRGWLEKDDIINTRGYNAIAKKLGL